MFCVTPNGKNKFFVTCNDGDTEKLKVLGGIKLEIDDEGFMVEMCGVLEKILESL